MRIPSEAAACEKGIAGLPTEDKSSCLTNLLWQARLNIFYVELSCVAAVQSTSVL